jgi:hypothetical protein
MLVSADRMLMRQSRRNRRDFELPSSVSLRISIEISSSSL